MKYSWLTRNCIFGLLFLLMVVSVIFTNQLQREKNIKYFNENSSKILSDVRDAIKSKEYEKAISLSEEYLPSGNLELLKLYQSAKSALAEIHKTEKTKEILAELKTIPEKEYKKNRDLYQQLTALHPDSEKYKLKLSYYKAKMAEEKKKQQLAAEHKKRIERQLKAEEEKKKQQLVAKVTRKVNLETNLEYLIKMSMNDPDSYDHVETVYWDMGDYLVVKTIFRGKNAFGGVVVNWVKAKGDLDGNIIEIIETYP